MNIGKKKAIFRRLQSNDQIESRGITGNVNAIHKSSLYSSKSSNQCCLDCGNGGQNCSNTTNHKHTQSVKKCPSFPRLAMARPNTDRLMGVCEHSRTSPLSLSNTQLSCVSYNDSISPQVSMDNLALDDRSEGGRWPGGGYADDTQSASRNGTFQISADSASRGMRQSGQRSGKANANYQPGVAPFLSPNPHHKISPLISPRLVSRSTSCPSMTNSSKRTRSLSAITSPVSSKPDCQMLGSEAVTGAMADGNGDTVFVNNTDNEISCSCQHSPRLPSADPADMTTDMRDLVIRNDRADRADRKQEVTAADQTDSTGPCRKCRGDACSCAAPHGDHPGNKQQHVHSDCCYGPQRPSHAAKAGALGLDTERSQDDSKLNTCFEQRPMHTRRILHGSDRDHWRITHHHQHRGSGAKSSRGDAASKRVTFTQGYVNIGDIPTYLAEKVISEREPYKPDASVTSSVTRKCLQWLNSLDSDDEGQGC